MLKDKNAHFQNELKIANHKIEKIEILNEKAERLQAKKEIEIIKEIEERVKKELRGNSSTNTPIGSVTNQVGSVKSIQGQGNGVSGATNVANISNFYTRKESK